MRGNIAMFYHIPVLNTGLSFSRQGSMSLISVSMETKGTISTLLQFFKICSNRFTQFLVNI